MFDALHVAVENRLLDTTNMPGATKTNSAIYDALLAVKPEDLSLNAWTVKAGVGRSMFTEIRRHGNPTAETLQKLLDVIGVSLSDLYKHVPGSDANPLVSTEVKAAGMSAHDVERAWHGPQPQKPVPLLGTAFGGEWSEGVELTELHLTDVLDYLVRPEAVARDNEAYAVEIVGDSMVPRYEPGERVFVSPRAAVRPGDDVIVQLKGALSGNNGEDRDHLPDPDFAARVTTVLIKRLVRQTAKTVELQQFNPPLTFEVPANRVAAIHRVRVRL